MLKQKSFRFLDQTIDKLDKLKDIYKSKSQNQLLEIIIDDIYDLKQSKALIQIEEYKEKDLPTSKNDF